MTHSGKYWRRISCKQLCLNQEVEIRSALLLCDILGLCKTYIRRQNISYQKHTLAVSELHRCNFFKLILTCFFSSLSSTQDRTKSILRSPSRKNTESLLCCCLSIYSKREQRSQHLNTHIHRYSVSSTSLWMHSAQQTRKSNYCLCRQLTAKPKE